MEVKLLVCGVLLVSFMVTGSDAQLDVCGIAPLNPKVGAAGRKEADITDDIKPPGSNVSITIVGGNDARVGSWPWQVYVYDRNNFACGGSLINNQWVLIAAHCFTRSSNVNDLTVILGAYALQIRTINEVFRCVNQVIRHPNYDDIPHNNDIALLQLSSPVTFTDFIRPVCLAADGSVFNGWTNMWVTGWGKIQEDVFLPHPERLQEVNVPIVINSECEANYNGIYQITNNMMCAGLNVGGRGFCDGDSGGPLVIKNKNAKWIQGGMVSFSRGCARPGLPGVYTRVSNYQTWILSHITTNQPGFITFP